MATIRHFCCIFTTLWITLNCWFISVLGLFSLKKSRSLSQTYGTNKAQGCDKLSQPLRGVAQDVPVLFFLITKHSYREKDIDTPTPKNSKGPSIYTTPQKILANLEDLIKVSRERLYVPPGFSFPAF